MSHEKRRSVTQREIRSSVSESSCLDFGRRSRLRSGENWRRDSRVSEKGKAPVGASFLSPARKGVRPKIRDALMAQRHALAHAVGYGTEHGVARASFHVSACCDRGSRGIRARAQVSRVDSRDRTTRARRRRLFRFQGALYDAAARVCAVARGWVWRARGPASQITRDYKSGE